MGTLSQKSLSLLWTDHWSSLPAQDRSFCYKLWFMMLWWWVSLVYCLVHSDAFFPFMFPHLYLLFAASEKKADHGLHFFLGIGVYACATDGIWVKSVHVFFHAVLKASALPHCPDFRQPKGPVMKRAGRKTKAEKSFVLLVMSTGLGWLSWQEGCSSPGSFGPSLWPWVRSCSAQHRVANIYGVCAWRRNCILAYSRSQRLRVDLSSWSSR